MFKTIMVPTDGSKYAGKAEDIAISLAKKFHSKVKAVHVIDEKLIYPYEVLEEEGNTILNKVALKGQEQGVEVEKILIFGNPYQDMVKITHRTNADLVVIGTHGKTDFEKILMGSVAESIIKNVTIPVLLIK